MDPVFGWAARSGRDVVVVASSAVTARPDGGVASPTRGARGRGRGGRHKDPRAGRSTSSSSPGTGEARTDIEKKPTLTFSGGVGHNGRGSL